MKELLNRPEVFVCPLCGDEIPWPLDQNFIECPRVAK